MLCLCRFVHLHAVHASHRSSARALRRRQVLLLLSSTIEASQGPPGEWQRLLVSQLPGLMLWIFFFFFFSIMFCHVLSFRFEMIWVYGSVPTCSLSKPFSKASELSALPHDLWRTQLLRIHSRRWHHLGRTGSSCGCGLALRTSEHSRIKCTDSVPRRETRTQVFHGVYADLWSEVILLAFAKRCLEGKNSSKTLNLSSTTSRPVQTIVWLSD